MRRELTTTLQLGTQLVYYSGVSSLEEACENHHRRMGFRKRETEAQEGKRGIEETLVVQDIGNYVSQPESILIGGKRLIW